MKKTFSIGLVLVLSITTVNLKARGIWTQKADMPTARELCGANAVNEMIYVIGGWDAWNDPTPLATVEVYDPATDIWERKADMPTARGALATAVVDGKIYAIGGGRGSSALRTVEVYDPATDTWQEKASMSMSRRWHAAAVVDGKIYALGGYHSSTMEMYDPATDTWTRNANMPTIRWVAGIGVVNGKIYVFGGDTGSVTSSVLEYDPASDSWIQKTNMPAARAALSAAVVNGKVYTIGGDRVYGGPGLPTVEAYDPVMDTWEKKDDMPAGKTCLTTAVMNGRIYAIGGAPASGSNGTGKCFTTVYEYDPNPLIVDFSGDGIVNGIDLSMMIDYWHTDEPFYDIAPQPFGDGIVDVQDLVLLSEHLFEEPGLIAHWKLDEADSDIAYDSAGINNAIVSGNALWHPDRGQIDGALQFDGIDDYVITPFVLNPAEEAFSIFAWVGNGSPGQTIVAQTNRANWLCVDPIDGNLMTELNGIGRSGRPLSSQEVITDGQWHRIGLVWDGLNRTLYIDDLVVAEDTQNGLESSDNGMYIGCGKNMEAGSYWSGLIDDVRIYNRAVIP